MKAPEGNESRTDAITLAPAVLRRPRLRDPRREPGRGPERRQSRGGREGAGGGSQAAVAIAADLATTGGTTKLTLTLSPADRGPSLRHGAAGPGRHRSRGSELPARRRHRAQARRPRLLVPLRPLRAGALAHRGGSGPARQRRRRIETVTRTRDGAVLLSIEFQRADREAFRRAAVASDPAPALRKAVAPEATDTRAPSSWSMPGTAHRSGRPSRATGVFEKDIVFGFAQALVSRLEANGRYPVRMTRDRATCSSPLRARPPRRGRPRRISSCRSR